MLLEALLHFLLPPFAEPPLRGRGLGREDCLHELVGFVSFRRLSADLRLWIEKLAWLGPCL